MRLRTLTPLLCGLCLAAPGSAAALPVTLGSPLAPGPVDGFGCETQPVLNPSTGDYFPAPSNQPDCTWRQTGVVGVVDNSDPRGSTAPGTGRITSVSVRSGANPAPLRFVILRMLGQPVTGTACCYFVTETPPVQPAPDTVSTFAVNLPVERNADGQGVLAWDFIGISAASGTGSLPIRTVGSHNAFAFTQPGSVNAGFIYPRLSAPGQFDSGRHEDGTGGFEVLLQWTWCAAGDPTCAGGGGGQAPPVSPQPVRTPPAVANNFTVRQRILCNGTCAVVPVFVTVPGPGRLSAAPVAPNAATAAKKRRTGPTALIAAASKRVKAAGKAKLKLKPTKAGKQVLDRKGSLSSEVRITFKPTGGKARSKVVTVKLDRDAKRPGAKKRR